jgi:triacylglycerol lipase
LGDHLARTGNGLATSMTCVVDGRPLTMERAALERAHPQATPRIVVLVHGLMCSEDIWRLPDASDYGSLLARDLVVEYPVPIEEIVPTGFSMGGLVVRSACHVARLEGLAWLTRMRRAMYVGTPHLGAPMERVGRFVSKVLRAVDDPYTRLAAELADLRSDGMKDLGDADLRHEDRERRLPDHVKIVGGASHMTLAHDLAVYEHLRGWCSP